MQPQILVVSDPPHGAVDYEVAATILGLAVSDARMKIGFPAPEVLKASDEERALEVAVALSDAGLSLAVVDGGALADIPWPRPASEFAFGSESLVARLPGGNLELSYDTPVLGVYCKPPSDFTIWREDDDGSAALAPDSEGLAIAEAIEWMTILDLYFTRDGRAERLSIVQDITDLSGMRHLQGDTLAESMAAAVEECERRFTRLELDIRLENVRPRQRFLAGDVGFDMDMRKLYSFGTLLLRQVVESIAPELRDVTQYELGSRLAYVTSRHGGVPRLL